MKAGQFLTFKLNNTMYGIEIGKVREINRMSAISSVPDAPEYVSGVLNLRGTVISIVDLRKKFHLQSSEVNNETCIIVIDTSSGTLGVIVDSVEAVISLVDAQIDSSPITQIGQDSVRGIAKLENDLILLIDLYSSFEQNQVGEKVA